MRALLGSTHYTATLFWILAAFVTILFLSTIFAVFYHRIFYRRFRRTKYDDSYKPRCSIILPCKGLNKDLKRNLESFLNLDYPDYEVLYAVESGDDPAIPTINEVVSQAPGKAKLVVAGLSQNCCQKNFNQLAALEKTIDPEVYVFADADIGPTATWLHELVIPLSDTSNAATTGFRWQFAPNGKVGEEAHSFQNNVMYVAFCAAAIASNMGLVWGGSMAIRKETFEELNVAERWAETVVDDFSLSQIIHKEKRKAILVPTCVTLTDDALESFMGGVRWFERQVMFLKYYHTKTWVLVAMPLFSILLLSMVWFPTALVLSKGSLSHFLAIGGAAPLVLILGGTLSTLLHPLLGENRTFVRFVAFAPISMFSLFLGSVRTMFTNTISWGGIEYRTKLNGKVTSIHRLG